MQYMQYRQLKMNNLQSDYIIVKNLVNFKHLWEHTTIYAYFTYVLQNVHVCTGKYV